MFKSVLVVCTGNICRSPVGERALAALCPHLTVNSAGIGALVGKGVDKDAAAVARAHNVNVEGHAARQTRLIYGSLVPSAVLIAIYACVVCLPLLTSSAPGVRPFGILVAASMLLTMLFAGYAFKSVWCYLAAISSAYLALMMWRLPKLAQRRVFEA